MSKFTFPLPDDYIRKLTSLGSPEHALVYGNIIEMANRIQSIGGEIYLVGGCVRDEFMGLVPKDFDIEVFGLEIPDIISAINGLGRVNEVGKSFGIIKITFENGLDIDISIPRTDSKIGDGHTGFEITQDPFMSVQNALKRRDFTINSIAVNPITGEIHDPFHGIQDLQNKLLRITDESTFGDDPLRILRALQFISRFELTLDEKSIDTVKRMIPKLRTLSKERIGEEWKKLLLKSKKPSIGLSLGMELGVFNELHPQLPPLVITEQSPQWHPEGNVWIHTLMVLDEAVNIVKRYEMSDEDRFVILLASFCHDFGKPGATKSTDGRVISYGHEEAGDIPTRSFLNDLGIDLLTQEKVARLVVHHLALRFFYDNEFKSGQKLKDGAIRKLALKLHPASIHELILVSEADHLGRGPFTEEEERGLSIPSKDFPVGPWMTERASTIEVLSERPKDLIQGRDWIDKGHAPGKLFSQLISLSNNLRDEKGFTKEMVLEVIGTDVSTEDAILQLQSILEI